MLGGLCQRGVVHGIVLLDTDNNRGKAAGVSVAPIERYGVLSWALGCRGGGGVIAVGWIEGRM